MTSRKRDRADFKPYRRVVGGDIPLHRVTRTDEDADGRGTMFLTQQAATFTTEGYEGTVCQIVGGGIVVSIRAKGDTGEPYQYLVKLDEIADTAMRAFLERLPDGDAS